MNIGNGTLVMVADGKKLLVFRNDGSRMHPALTTLVHEEADNPASREQGADAAGHVRSSMGAGGSSYGDTDWHEQSEANFARHAADMLEEFAVDGRDADIVVIAPPRTLGKLREHYRDRTSKQVIGEIAKDLARHTTDNIVHAIAVHTP